MINRLAVFRQGYWWPLAVGERVTLTQGDVLKVSISVPFRGPKETFTRYGAIGTRHTGPLRFDFDEILVARAALECPESPDKFTTVEGSVDIEIIAAGMLGLGGISPGVNYDLMVKIEEKPEVYAEIDDIIDITGAAAPDMTGMMGMMVMLMMLGMVMPMATEGME